MSDPYEIKKAKINSLVMAFTNSGYKSSNRIGQIELLQFLSKLTNTGNFDHILADKLFQVLNLDQTSTMSVEDFINGYLQFEDDLRRNAEIFHIKLKQEQEIYDNLVEQCRRYKSEKLNAEGLCENAKVYGEITDIDIKRKLEGIKEIIIKIIYNEKFEELHFKIGDTSSNEMLNKTFGFKPTSRKDHFEFIMKGVNDRNQVFDIGSKVFPLNDINSYEEYIVQIIIPEIDNEEQVAAYINAKIVLYWSDYKYYERLRRKAESRLKKLIAATSKATQYLKYIREIYGDLTRKKSDLVVDFNNEKLMQRKGAKLNVHFNNQKQAETTGSNYLVEFNNLREVQKNLEPIRVEYNNTKEVVVENKITEDAIKSIKPQIEQIEKLQSQLEKIETSIKQTETNLPTLPIISKIEEIEATIEKATLPTITKLEEEQTTIRNETGPYITKVVEEEQTIRKETGPYITKVEEEPKVEYLPPQQDYSYLQQTQTQVETTNNVVPNQYQEYNANVYTQPQNDQMATTTTTTTTTETTYDNGMGAEQYGGSGTVQSYEVGGYQYMDQSQSQNQEQTAQLRSSEIIKETEFRNSINRAIVNESTKETLFTKNTLPVKVLQTKINKVIFDNNVKTLPLIYGGKNVTYDNRNEEANYDVNAMYQTAPVSQGYTYESQETNTYGNQFYSSV